MTWIFEDRRQRRSADRFVAVRYQLEHVRGKGSIEAMTLADEHGLAVASSGDAAVCTELAAIAPLVSRTIMGLPLPPLLKGAEVAVRPVKIHGERLFLACVGGNVARDAHLSQSVRGVERIMAYN